MWYDWLGNLGMLGRESWESCGHHMSRRRTREALMLHSVASRLHYDMQLEENCDNRLLTRVTVQWRPNCLPIWYECGFPPRSYDCRSRCSDTITETSMQHSADTPTFGSITGATSSCLYTGPHGFRLRRLGGGSTQELHVIDEMLQHFRNVTKVKLAI